MGRDVFNAAPFNANGSGNIAADYVCWGVANPNGEPNRIYDFFDNSSLGLVLPSNPVVCDPVGNLGAGEPGIGGVPTLTGAFASPQFTVRLTNAAPNAAGLLFVALAPPIYTYLSTFEVILVTGAAGASLPIVTDGSGAFALPAAIGAVPPGLCLTFHAAVVDTAAANGLTALSNALVLQF